MRAELEPGINQLFGQCSLLIDKGSELFPKTRESLHFETKADQAFDFLYHGSRYPVRIVSSRQTEGYKVGDYDSFDIYTSPNILEVIAFMRASRGLLPSSRFELVTDAGSRRVFMSGNTPRQIWRELRYGEIVPEEKVEIVKLGQRALGIVNRFNSLLDIRNLKAVSEPVANLTVNVL